MSAIVDRIHLYWEAIEIRSKLSPPQIEAFSRVSAHLSVRSPHRTHAHSLRKKFKQVQPQRRYNFAIAMEKKTNFNVTVAAQAKIIINRYVMSQ